ncbi:WAT1-related protein At1g25270-like isoform X3 [Oryza glaberrima]|uniref:WAT1-related protein At1g25270-like isoform X3 n=1 Tax=Oryza glaberrima TaxID=4538 RepID=UPI00224C03ED|nr:WAT1-related protein At1g25270-like isoform X3 [Oryza glaberrima]
MDIDGAGTKAAAAGWKAPASMVLVQLFITGMIMLSKVSIGGGMFIFALLAYRSLFGAVFILPFALIFERGKWRDMDWCAFGWIFFNAFIGYAVPMSLYFYGLKDTTASYAVIFINIIPLFTFILSLMFRLETFEIGSMVGVLKIVGVLLSVGGTMVVSLYKGKSLHLWNSILQHQNEHTTKTATNQLRGTILLVASSFAYACWYLVQAAFVGIILRRHKSAWKLGWDLNLVTVVYSGALATAGKYSLNSWAVAKRGPAYPPMFNPLSVVFTVVLDSVFMGDDVTVGSFGARRPAVRGFRGSRSRSRARVAEEDEVDPADEEFFQEQAGYDEF